MIKAIFFDLDGVITADESGSFTTCKYIADHLGEDYDVYAVLKVYRLFHPKLLVGELSHSEIWEKFCKDLKVKVPRKVLYRAFSQTPINPQMIELCKILNLNFKLGIITDNSLERVEVITEVNRLGNLFSSIICSGQVGYKKDKRVIFDQALSSLGAKATESIFIDNNKDNLVVPEQMGFQTIYYNHDAKNVELLKRELTELLGVSL